jgi:hypothetical protein
MEQEKIATAQEQNKSVILQDETNASKQVVEVDHSKPTADLPMIVILKGDEPYFKEFSWDSNKVMHLLGIKRSRLNQVSGQELRVGRTRIDRYIRPVYRPCDVEKYLEWTRPTATHQRSTKIIDSAREKLESQSRKLEEQISTLEKTLRLSIQSFIKKHELTFITIIKEERHNLTAELKQYIKTIYAELKNFELKLLQSTKNLQTNNNELLSQIKAQKSKIEHITIQTEQIQNTLSHLQNSLSDNYKNILLEIKNNPKKQPLFEKYHCISKQKIRRPTPLQKHSLRKKFLQKKAKNNTNNGIKS